MITAAFSSDHHINSNSGLLAPRIQLDGGGWHEHNEYQAITWKYFLDYCANFAKQPGEKLVVMHGDLFDLDYLGGQRISDNSADIMKMGEATLQPLLDVAAYKIVVRGTDKHGGKCNYLEEMFAQRIGAQRCIETGDYSYWHLRQNIAGVNVNVGHHISIGNKPWNEVNAAYAKMYEVMVNDLRQGYPMPQLIIRGHVHTPINIKTNDINCPMQLIITPSWQGKNSHGYKVALDKPTVHGSCIAKFENGKYEADNVLYLPRKDSVWTL